MFRLKKKIIKISSVNTFNCDVCNFDLKNIIKLCTKYTDMFSFLLYFLRPSTEKGHASLINKDGKMQIWVRFFKSILEKR